MSGTGKSTVIARLAAGGYEAVDLDCDEFSEWVSDNTGSSVEANRDWVWREDQVQALLSSNTEVLFVSGCAPNMGKFLSQFDSVILLSAPVGVIVERLATRTTNAYGKRPDEAARVLDLINSVEPLLRKAADHEIDTSASLDVVVATVLQLAQVQAPD